MVRGILGYYVILVLPQRVWFTHIIASAPSSTAASFALQLMPINPKRKPLQMQLRINVLGDRAINRLMVRSESAKNKLAYVFLSFDWVVVLVPRSRNPSAPTTWDLTNGTLRLRLCWRPSFRSHLFR